jgi:hypothetical protein
VTVVAATSSTRVSFHRPLDQNKILTRGGTSARLHTNGTNLIVFSYIPVLFEARPALVLKENATERPSHLRERSGSFISRPAAHRPFKSEAREQKPRPWSLAYAQSPGPPRRNTFDT